MLREGLSDSQPKRIGTRWTVAYKWSFAFGLVGIISFVASVAIPAGPLKPGFSEAIRKFENPATGKKLTSADMSLSAFQNGDIKLTAQHVALVSNGVAILCLQVDRRRRKRSV